jgi:hypothetical protein
VVNGTVQHEITAIQLPSAQQTKILSAMNNLGDSARFGVERFAPDRYHADPAQLLDTLIVEIVGMLVEMPVSTQGARRPQRQSFPEAAFGNPPSESMLWQLGLDGVPSVGCCRARSSAGR